MSAPLAAPQPAPEHVVLVDVAGRPTGTLPKADAHHRRTPLHLAFSCYLVDDDGAVLLARRALDKRTWPGAWSNACCGHPQLGETLRAAVVRRSADELGARVSDLRVLLPDYAYRFEMPDGTVEHELCPVVWGRVDGPLRPDPIEVDDVSWTSWSELVDRAAQAPASLSPWCVEQVRMLDGLGLVPGAEASGSATTSLLDEPIVVSAGRSPSGPTRPTLRPLRSADGGASDPVRPVLGALDEVLDDFLDEKLAELRDLDPGVVELGDELVALVRAGGKRLRPAFVHWGHVAAGGERPEDALPVAAAMELLHTFALVHDDVMDRSTMRRGRPSAHVGFTARHQRRGSEGDAAWFGTSAAVLAGDLAHVWADEVLERSSAGIEARDRARRVFAALRSEVIAGQHLDLRLAADRGADDLGAARVALLKSARYTVTRPLQLGAALVDDVDPALDDALRGYGDAVGMAFQVRDDVLGLFGDEQVTGKGVVDDLREGKRTVLVLRALRLADDAGRAELAAALGDPTLDADAAERCRVIVAESGALASVERLVASLHEQALGHLDALPASSRVALTALADRATERDR